MPTPRQKQIIKLIIKGYTNKEIAQALSIKESTVKIHNNTIFSKLNVRNRVEIIVKKAKFEKFC